MREGLRKKRTLWFLYSVGIISFVWVLFAPSLKLSGTKGDNYYRIVLDDVFIGNLGDREEIRACLREARRRIAGNGDELVLAENDLVLEATRAWLGKIDDAQTVTDRMTQVLTENIKSTLNRSYTVKINNYSVNLPSMDDVEALVTASKDQYDEEGGYGVTLNSDPTREVNVLTASVVSNRETEIEEVIRTALPQAGIEKVFTEAFTHAEANPELMAFEDFTLGLRSLSFGDKVEIVEAYLPEEELTDVGDAISEVTKDKETNKIYEVVAGDTLSGIASRFDLSLSDLIAMNPTLEDETSIIRAQDELIVTVPEPLLTVMYTKEEYVEESFEAPTEYIDNNSWYRDETVVRQEPTTGQRRIIALASYAGGEQVGREILKQEVTVEARPRIIERGTRVRPTYMKPISGGRVTSGFGRRNAPNRYASTYHRGVDWGTPIGTAVKASSGGTVARAGWLSSYGYCVFINHPDGRQTRYAHLSRVLVKPGQFVNQGEKIALSGNTGNSTGPHLHFEILSGGTPVNPLSIIQ